MSMSEYREMFPDVSITSMETRDKLPGHPAWNKGIPRSEQTKAKISKACHGRVPWNKGMVGLPGYRKGAKHTQEARHKMSKAHTGMEKPWARSERVDVICPYCGAVSQKTPYEAELYVGFCNLEHWYAYLDEHPDAHPNWRGGVSSEPWPFEFDENLKEQIRARDGFRCQLCGVSADEHASDGRQLSVHHMDYDKNNCDPANLVTLCVVCHSRVNYRRDYYYELFRKQQIARGLCDG